MRKIKEITLEEENFRLDPFGGENMKIVKRDPIEPEPIGTIVLLPFKITGYDKDCDGSLMARLSSLSLGDMREDGWETSHIGLYPDSGFVVTKKELKELSRKSK